MTELISLAVALLIFAAIIVAIRKWRRDSTQTTHSADAKVKTYAAVGIRYNLLACKSVQKYYGQRYLAQDAPALPVPNCNVRPCPCRYVHFADRRSEDRRTEYGVPRNLVASSERRHSDRRRAPAFA